MGIIRGLREDRDVKQIEIANLLGISQQHYSKYENGENELPTRLLVLLADYYNVSTDFLLGRTSCREGITGQNKKVSAERTAGEVISDILSLNAANRAAVLECISLRKLKESCEKK